MVHRYGSVDGKEGEPIYPTRSTVCNCCSDETVVVSADRYSRPKEPDTPHAYLPTSNRDVRHTESMMREQAYNGPLHRYAWIVTGSILFLIFVGGMVKSTNAGLSVPDWPNTYGHFMFTFPLDRMIGGVFWEHSHRMIASVVGAMTVALTIWIYVSDSRIWVRRVGLWASIAVVVQGIFGGLTVLLYLPAWTSTIHGTLAQVYLGMVLLIALATSRRWVEYQADRDVDVGSVSLLRRRSSLFVGVILMQLLVGAIMRHIEAGLVIPDFPTMFGSWLPPFSAEAIASANAELAANGYLAKARLPEAELQHMVMHVLHRLGALVVTIIAAMLAIGIARNPVVWSDRSVKWGTIGSVMLLIGQVTLGILTIYSGRNPTITTFHVLGGALLLSTAIAVTAHLRKIEVRSERNDRQSHVAENGVQSSEALTENVA